MKKFQLAGHRDPTKPDARGSVQVRIILFDGGRPKKGNLTRSFTLSEATVSEVYDAVLKSIVATNGKHYR